LSIRDKGSLSKKIASQILTAPHYKIYQPDVIRSNQQDCFNAQQFTMSKDIFL